VRYMLDTNICIYLIQQHPPQVITRLAHLAHGDVVMSVVTYAELRAGLETGSVNRSRDERALDTLTDRISVIDFDKDAAIAHGILRAAIPNRRRDALDRLIAAHAVSLRLTLVTNNEADFNGYPNLIVENWARSS